MHMHVATQKGVALYTGRWATGSRHITVAITSTHLQGAPVCAAMLSTAQALHQWQGVIGLLAQIKAHALAHQARPVPHNLLQQLDGSLGSCMNRLASPESTWTQLLQSKVSAPSGRIMGSCPQRVHVAECTSRDNPSLMGG